MSSTLSRPLDFFLWGTVKDEVYKRKPRNLDIFWNEIQKAVCREISLDILIVIDVLISSDSYSELC